MFRTILLFALALVGSAGAEEAAKPTDVTVGPVTLRVVETESGEEELRHGTRVLVKEFSINEGLAAKFKDTHARVFDVGPGGNACDGWPAVERAFTPVFDGLCGGGSTPPVRLRFCSYSLAAIASAIATVRRAISACMRSTMRPSICTTPLPLFSGRSNAAIICPRLRDLVQRRRERRIAGVDLVRMDQRLAVEAEIARLRTLGREAFGIGEVVVDAVEDIDAVLARGEQAGREPRQHRRAARHDARAGLLGEVVGAEHEAGEPGFGVARRRCDLAHVEDRGRRLDHGPDAHLLVGCAC